MRLLSFVLAAMLIGCGGAGVRPSGVYRPGSDRGVGSSLGPAVGTGSVAVSSDPTPAWLAGSVMPLVCHDSDAQAVAVVFVEAINARHSRTYLDCLFDGRINGQPFAAVSGFVGSTVSFIDLRGGVHERPSNTFPLGVEQIFSFGSVDDPLHAVVGVTTSREMDGLYYVTGLTIAVSGSPDAVRIAS